MTPLPPTPILITRRLILRPLEARDAPAIQHIFADWRVVRWLHATVPWPYPADGAETHVSQCLASRALGEKFHWAITLKGSDALRGRIDLWPFDGKSRDMRGFWLDPELHGRGLMTEAANAVTGYAFETLEWPFLYLTNAAENRASARVKEKQGATEIARERHPFVSGEADRQVWLLTRETWLARRGWLDQLGWTNSGAACYLCGMTIQINIAEAKARLSELVARAEAGEEVIIARAGKPVVVLKRSDAARLEPRKPGAWAHLGKLDDPYLLLRPDPELEDAADGPILPA